MVKRGNTQTAIRKRGVKNIDRKVKNLFDGDFILNRESANFLNLKISMDLPKNVINCKTKAESQHSQLYCALKLLLMDIKLDKVIYFNVSNHYCSGSRKWGPTCVVGEWKSWLPLC